MSTEHNSLLLSRLNSDFPEQELWELLDEIKEIGDPIFLYPLYSLYQSKKNKGIAFKIVDIIGKIKSPSKEQIIKDILREVEPGTFEFDSILNIIIQEKYFDAKTFDILQSAIPILIKEKKMSFRDIKMGKILTCFNEAKLLPQISDYLQSVYEDSSFGSSTREYALENWIGISSDNRILSLIENYSKIKEEEALEKAFVRISMKFPERQKRKIQDKIFSEGSVIAKDTLLECRNKQMVQNIVALKDTINNDAICGLIGIYIFGRNNNIEKQFQTISSEEELMSKCSFLRISIQDFNPLLKNYGISKEEIQKIFPDIPPTDLKKSINSLEIYSFSKGLDIKDEVRELRKINNLVGLLSAHTNLLDDKIEMLKNFKLFNIYEEHAWGELHYQLLKLYYHNLKKLKNKIS